AARSRSRSVNKIDAKPAVSTSCRAARVPTSPAPTTNATVIARSSELGPVELAPTALGRRKLALAPQARDHSDRSGHPQDEQRPPKDAHRRSVSDARGRGPGGASWNRTSDLILIRDAL